MRVERSVFYPGLYFRINTPDCDDNVLFAIDDYGDCVQVWPDQYDEHSRYSAWLEADYINDEWQYWENQLRLGKIPRNEIAKLNAAAWNRLKAFVERENEGPTQVGRVSITDDMNPFKANDVWIGSGVVYAGGGMPLRQDISIGYAFDLAGNVEMVSASIVDTKGPKFRTALTLELWDAEADNGKGAWRNITNDRCCQPEYCKMNAPEDFANPDRCSACDKIAPITR